MRAHTTTPTAPEIYMRVKDHRQLQKLLVIQADKSARDLSKACGDRSHTYVQRILRGEVTTVTPERAARIARYFEVGVDDLFVARLSTDATHSVKRVVA